ncbi:MAG: right-handed parallel beta-helix repeat-containing protein [Solirubrobacterales bacterium]
MPFRHMSVLVATVALALAAGGMAPAGALGQDAGCDLVATSGDSVQELLDDLAPGQTGCVRAGTYVADQFIVNTSAIRLTSYPGELATLQGRLRLNETADDAVIENLNLDGRNPEGLLGPIIYADRVVLRNNDITNHHTAICVHVDAYEDSPPPDGVLIEGNRIHDCGDLPATNHDHGIYLAEARNTVIRGNWIYGNADRGIQFYPDADGSLVTGNVIDGNGQGVLFAGGDDSASDNNVVEKNVITNSTIRYNIESHWQGESGYGNVARANCVSGGARDDGDGGIESPQDGFVAVDNRVADPYYVDASKPDYNLQASSPCLGGAPSRAQVKLSANRRRVQPQQRFRLRGELEGAVSGGGRRAVIQVRERGRWKRFARARVNTRNRFTIRKRARSSAGRLRLRAKVPGIGRSRPVRVKVRR